MKLKRLHTDAAQLGLAGSPGTDGPARDISGYAVFSDGDAGAVHVMAHRTLDDNRFELGHRVLGKWLDERRGLGSEWVHLQFHMAVFDLALDNWAAAHARFLNEILPAAATTHDALTDAPALLWRLALSANGPVELPWETLRQTALVRMRQPDDPFVELHNLLALAGAGDTASIEQWLTRRRPNDASRRECLVYRMAQALFAFAARAYGRAALILTHVVPLLPQVGGSRAQNQLFSKIQQASLRQAREASLSSLYAIAA